MKRCSKCGEVKSLDSFQKASARKDGLRSACKTCDNKYAKQYRESNKEKCLLASRLSGRKNKEKRYAYTKEYIKQNKDSVSKQQRSYKEANKDTIKTYMRSYRKANPEKFLEYKARRREQTSRGIDTLSPTELFMIRGLYTVSQILSRSCGEIFHVDHITPLSKGGTHTFNNLQVLSAEENLRKGSKI